MVSDGGPPDPGAGPVVSQTPTLIPQAGHGSMRDRMAKERYAFECFQSVRLLERLAPDRTAVGWYAPPSREAARFKVNQQFTFPASEIQRIEFACTVNFMGLTGSQGVLMIHYTEFIRERLCQRDTATAGFLDVFNHRMISLFFRAWEKYRFPIASERGDRDRFAQSLLDLVWFGTPGLQGRMPVPDDALLFYSGLLSSRHRLATGLAYLISDYFDVPGDIQQFKGAWYPLNEDSLCVFNHADGLSEQLGVGAIGGDDLYDQNSAVPLIFGPLALQQYQDFLPDGSVQTPMKEMARFYAGLSMDFVVQLILAKDEVPAAHFGLGQEPPPVPGSTLDGVQLGWTSWVKTKLRTADGYDAVLRF